jgi:hypothetical protein
MTTDAEVTAEEGVVSLTLWSPLNSLDRRFLNPNFDERPEEETDLVSLAFLVS